MKVLKVPRLPDRSSLGSSKCDTCHTKRGSVHTGQARPQASADLHEGTESATPAACQTDRACSNAAPATQNEAASTQDRLVATKRCHTKRGGVHTGQACRQASADLYEGTGSTTAAYEGAEKCHTARA